MGRKALTKREENFPQWYLDVVDAADLAEHSAVRGCMVIKPHGYAIWENMQKVLDKKFKDTGHSNAYFPVLIPKSFLCKEAEHIDGFAKECAVVTHHRLKNDPDGKGVIVDPDAKLTEEYVIRPTSETIIYDTYSRWVESWRDLPLLLNQWANVMRWEMRTRLFLRTAEFLWQEGHTAHATHEEAAEEVAQMLEVYKDFAENYLAISVIPGRKSENEKFAGADYTTTIEGMMQDGKALQMGTSHHLGQNFAKGFDVKFTDKDGQIKYVYNTSWGASTRMIGALIMSHSDDRGLVLPPKISPLQVVIVPIFKDETKDLVLSKAEELKKTLEVCGDIKIDDRDYLSPGNKFNEWEKKGIPVRIEIGPKDIENENVVFVRRDLGEKQVVAFNSIVGHVQNELEQMQKDLLTKNKAFRESHTVMVDTYEEFKNIIEKENKFILAHWCGDSDIEEQIAKETKATIRCIPFEDLGDGEGKCMVTGKPSKQRVVFAKAY